MKKNLQKILIIPFAILLSAINCAAVGNTMKEMSEAKIKNLTSLSIGFGVPTGLIGLQQEYLLTANDSIVASLGIDMAGFLKGIGYRRHGEFFASKCFFVVDCKSRYGLGIDLLHSSPYSVEIKSTQGERKYSAGSQIMGDLFIGDQSLFDNGIVFSSGISYRIPLGEKSIRLTEGVEQKGDRDSIRLWSHGLGLSVAIGYSY